MRSTTMFLATSLLAASAAYAADAAPPTDATSNAQAKPVARRVLAPTIHVMSATRQPDGTLAIGCTQRPNPVIVKSNAPNSPHKNGGEP